MNILFVSPNSPFESSGGVERYIINLISYYNSHALHKVFLVLPTKDDNYTEMKGNVTIYYDNSLSIPLSTLNQRSEMKKKVYIFLESIKNIIENEKIDIICAENFLAGPTSTYCLPLNIAAMLYKIPLVLRLHSFAGSAFQVELITQLMWNNVSCVSKSVTGDCFQKGINIETLSTEYLGVNTDEFNPLNELKYDLKKKFDLPKETRIISTATRIIRGSSNILQEKGLINLIQAFSKLSPRYPHLRLVLAIGKAPDRLQESFDSAYAMLLGYLKLHNIEKSTIVHLFPLDEMLELYRGSDIFVLASENETFGQVFIEAMSSGVPVIGTKVGGIPEIISDLYNGYLIQPQDASILAQRIEKLITDKTLSNSFIEAGMKTVKRSFTSDIQFMVFQKMLEKTVKEYSLHS